MGKCLHCRDRKGKRHCPHLRGGICAGCCGANRRTVFPCPEDCPYLHAGDAYLRSRAAPEIERRFHARYGGYLRAGRERLAEDVFRLEAILFRLAAERSRFVDADAVEAVEFVRRSLGPVATVEHFPSPLGREILAEATRALGPGGPGRREEVHAAAGELLAFLKTASDGVPGSRAYLDLLRLAGEPAGFARATRPEPQRPSGIILPGER